MILHFQISEGDSILVAAAQVAAIREAGDFLAIYLAGGEPILVPLNDYNCSAVTLWQEYIEGGKNGGRSRQLVATCKTEDDARFIAAGPEMYELLNKIRTHIDSTCRECESKAIVPEIDTLLDKIEEGGKAKRLSRKRK